MRSLSLAVVGVEDVDNEVDMQVELQLFSVEIPSNHLSRNQLMPCFEELFSLTSVE